MPESIQTVFISALISIVTALVVLVVSRFKTIQKIQEASGQARIDMASLWMKECGEVKIANNKLTQQLWEVNGRIDRLKEDHAKELAGRDTQIQELRDMIEKLNEKIRQLTKTA